MLNFIMITAAIYVAMVGTMITGAVIVTSDWYIKRAQKITMKMFEYFCKEE